MYFIEPLSRIPVYEQLIEQIERYILAGILKSNEQLPSVRTMSVSLAVNPNTIQKAYSELDSKKIIFSVPGKGCFVSENAIEIIGNYKRLKLNELSNTLNELKLANITKEEILALIDSVYNERS